MLRVQLPVPDLPVQVLLQVLALRLVQALSLAQLEQVWPEQDLQARALRAQG